MFFFQKTVEDWENYEGEKTNLIQYLKKAEAELEKPPSTTGQELAKKDYTTKKVNYSLHPYIIEPHAKSHSITFSQNYKKKKNKKNFFFSLT